MRLKDEDLKEKNRWMDLSIDLGKPIKHEGSTNMPSIEDLKGFYVDLYIAGDMNSWNGLNYKMEYLGNGTYTISFSIYNDYKNLYHKIYDGSYWRINWSIKNNRLLMYDTDAIHFSNVKKDSLITITINTITKEASYYIK